VLRPLIALTLALTLTACAGKDDATLNLTVHGLAPGLEGSVIFLHIDGSRKQLDWADYTAPIPSGHHVVSLETATCEASCPNLDPSTQEWCSNTVDVPVGGTLAIDIGGGELATGFGPICAIEALSAVLVPSG